MKVIILAVLMMIPLGLQAQDGRPWERYLNEVMTAEDAESEAWERTYELLCELEKHFMFHMPSDGEKNKNCHGIFPL